MIKKIKLVSVEIRETKDGKPLLNTKGQPYKMCIISGTEGKKASLYLGMFNGAWTKKLDVVSKWKMGDEVEVVLEQKGEYLNFDIPTNENRLEARVEALEKAVFSKTAQQLNAQAPDEVITDENGVAIPF